VRRGAGWPIGATPPVSSATRGERGISCGPKPTSPMRQGRGKQVRAGTSSSVALRLHFRASGWLPQGGT